MSLRISETPSAFPDFFPPNLDESSQTLSVLVESLLRSERTFVWTSCREYSRLVCGCRGSANPALRTWNTPQRKGGFIAARNV